MLKILWPVVVLLVGVAVAGALILHPPATPPDPPHDEPPIAQVVRVEPRTLRLTVHAQGVATPRTEIDWAAEVTGKIIRLHADFLAGGFFTAGEELLAIDPRDYDQAIAAAEARLAEAQRLLAQEQAQAEQARNEWQALGQGSPSPLLLHEPQLAEARARLAAARVDILVARSRRERCQLRAPFTGRVLSRRVGLGQYVQPGETLARLYATDVAEIRLPVAPEQLALLDLDLGRGHRQTGPKVTLSARPDGPRWEGRIVRAEAQVDPATGLLHLVAEVREPYAQHHSQPLLAGTFVQAEIEGRTQSAVAVLPPSAVNAAHEAWVVDAGQRLRLRHPQVLRADTDRVLVTAGLDAGDRVVMGGIPVPVEGMRVEPETVDWLPLATGSAP